MRLTFQISLIITLLGIAQAGIAQQTIGYYESEFILEQIPEYDGIQQQLELLNSQWNEEINKLENEIKELEEEFEAREILYTDEIRNQKKQEIERKRTEKENFIAQKFGPEGEYFRRQKELLEPIQRQVFTAVRAVAQRLNYDIVFDRSGDVYMVYAKQEFNLNEEILRELGIEIEQ